MNDLLGLFRTYTAAFDGFNPESIAKQYTLPCAISDSDGNQVFNTLESLVEKFQANCDAMKNIGYHSASFEIQSEKRLGDNARAVDIKWTIHTRSQKIPFRTLYICHLQQDEWRIFSANVYS